MPKISVMTESSVLKVEFNSKMLSSTQERNNLHEMLYGGGANLPSINK